MNLERTNARYLTREQIPEEIDFFSVDVSFISLKNYFARRASAFKGRRQSRVPY